MGKIKKPHNNKNLPTVGKQPQNQLHKIQQSIEVHSEHFSGPLPKPEILQQYNSVVPNGAERIFIMAERQSEHRQYIEKIVVKGDSTRAYYGLFVGGIVALSGLVISGFCIYNGHDWAGAAIGSVDLASMVSVFIYGTNSRRTERNRKAEMMKSATIEGKDQQ